MKFRHRLNATLFLHYQMTYWVHMFFQNPASFYAQYKIIINTCGTTIVQLPDKLSLTVKSVRYSRDSFIFAGVLSFPHRSITEELAVLDGYFGKLGLGIKAYVMGSIDKNQKWHVCSASAGSAHPSTTPVYSLEMCITGLNRKNAAVFFELQSGSAAEINKVCGIRKILHGSQICDLDFDPCGSDVGVL